MGFFNTPIKQSSTNSDGTKYQGFFSTGNQLPVLPPPPPPPTLGDRIIGAANTVTDFVGGSQLADYAGSKIAKAIVPEDQRQYVEDTTTGKQAIASGISVAANLIPASWIEKLGYKGAVAAWDASRMAKEGAAYGSILGASQSVAQGNGFFSTETAKNAAITGIAGGLGGRLLGEVGTALTNKVRTPEEYYHEALQRANLGPIPEAGRPTMGQQAVIDATQGTKLLNEPRPEPIQLPSPEIAASQRRINERPTIPEAPQIVANKASENIGERAAAFNSRNDFIAAEKERLQSTKATLDQSGNLVTTKIPKANKVSENELTKIWNNVHPGLGEYKMINPIEKTKRQTISSKAPKIQQQTEVPKAFTEKPKTEQAKKEYIPPQEDVVRAEKTLDQDPEYTPGTNREKVAAFFKHLAENTHNIDGIIDSIYSKDGGMLPKELPRSAAYQLLREQPQLLTPKQILRLTNSEPLSKAGQDLQAAKVKAGQILTNPLDMVDRLKKELMDRAEKIMTKKSIKQFLDDIECA